MFWLLGNILMPTCFSSLTLDTGPFIAPKLQLFLTPPVTSRKPPTSASGNSF